MQRPSRRTQPHRRGKPRQPTAALKAMVLGASPTAGNPADTTRGLQKLAKRRRHKGRK